MYSTHHVTGGYQADTRVLGHLVRSYAKRVVTTAAKRPVKTGKVDYGKDWYQQTRQNARRFKSVKEELEYYRKANWEANNGKERKDLYTDNWDGDVYKGAPWNILNLLIILFLAVPLFGLIFAWQTYGTLWG